MVGPFAMIDPVERPMMTPITCSFRQWLGAGLTAAALSALTAVPGLAQDRPTKHLTLVGIPSGTVAPHGTVFGSLALTNREGPGSSRDDGSIVLGFGLGSAEDTVGVELTMNISSLQSSFGDAGYFGIKASRRLSSGSWPIYASLGVDYLGPWGAVRGRDPGVTFALSSFGNIEAGGDSYPVMMTIGAGNRLRAGNTRPAVFAGVGVGLTQNLAASAAWSGEGLDLGLGLAFPELQGISFTLGASDVTNRVNSRRLVATATWSLQNVFGR